MTRLASCFRLVFEFLGRSSSLNYWWARLAMPLRKEFRYYSFGEKEREREEGREGEREPQDLNVNAVHLDQSPNQGYWFPDEIKQPWLLGDRKRGKRMRLGGISDGILIGREYFKPEHRWICSKDPRIPFNLWHDMERAVEPFQRRSTVSRRNRTTKIEIAGKNKIKSLRLKRIELKKRKRKKEKLFQ